MALPTKVVILELGLDDDLKAEIEKASQMSEDIQIKLKGQLDGLKQQQVAGKRAKEHRRWEGKLDIVFGVLKAAYDEDPSKHVSKTDIMQALACEEKDLSPIILKFKNFLRTAKEDKWTLSKKKIKGIASYALVPFA